MNIVAGIEALGVTVVGLSWIYLWLMLGITEKVPLLLAIIITVGVPAAIGAMFY